MAATGNDVRLLAPSLMNEIPNLVEYVYKKGVANYSMMNVLKQVWASYITTIMKKVVSTPDHSKLMELAVVQSFSIMYGLPFVPEAALSKMGSDCLYAPISDAEAEEGFKQLENLIRGSAEPGNFWFMRKLTTDLSKRQKEKIPTAKEIKLAIKCVRRFAKTSEVFKSNDILDVIQHLLKSDKLNRDYLRDIQWINLMSKGDVYLDYVWLYNRDVRERKDPQLKVRRLEEEKLAKEAAERAAMEAAMAAGPPQG